MQTESSRKTYCEFFAGIGLIHEALRRSGWRCVYANDIDASKRDFYLSRFTDADYYHRADVWETEEVVARIGERPFLATASFPCTDMSLAGQRRGFQGSESSAFFGFTAAIRQLGANQPFTILLENVTGFLASHGGRDFQAALEELASLGYWVDTFVLDAKDFVPQSRPRLFVLGYHEALPSGLIVRADEREPFWGGRWLQEIERSPRLRPKQLRAKMRQIELSTGWATVPMPAPKPARYQLADYLDLDDQQPWWNRSMVEKHYKMMSVPHRNQVDRWLSDRDRQVATVYRRVRKGRQRAEVRLDGVAGCLRTPRGGSARQIVLLTDSGQLRMRWMTPQEYARLQGADDAGVQQCVSRALFGFGDAVCVPVICWIDQHVLSPIFESASLATG
jgi:DNA (cytosine-5)-methyltransferase 1